MAADKRLGGQTVQFYAEPAVAAWASVVGKKEGEGPLRHTFDRIEPDDTLGLKSWEKAESRMLELAVETAIGKAGLRKDEIQLLACGDLLNQIISASFAARQLEMPYLGLYGACSTMAESLLVAGMMVDGGYMGNAVCATCSHFSTAERQYRMPLELGNQRSPTAQWTVTGAGATLLRLPALNDAVALTHATLGKVVDYGVTAADNMGAAMAPAIVIIGQTRFGRNLGDSFLHAAQNHSPQLGKYVTVCFLRIFVRRRIGYEKNAGGSCTNPAFTISLRFSNAATEFAFSRRVDRRSGIYPHFRADGSPRGSPP